MKIFNKIVMLLGVMVYSNNVFGQNPMEPVTDGDTTIVVSKELARKMLEEYDNVNEVKMIWCQIIQKNGWLRIVHIFQKLLF